MNTVMSALYPEVIELVVDSQRGIWQSHSDIKTLSYSNLFRQAIACDWHDSNVTIDIPVIVNRVRCAARANMCGDVLDAGISPQTCGYKSRLAACLILTGRVPRADYLRFLLEKSYRSSGIPRGRGGDVLPLTSPWQWLSAGRDQMMTGGRRSISVRSPRRENRVYTPFPRDTSLQPSPIE